MSDPLALVYDFEADLSRFGDEVENGATLVLQESAQTTAEAIVVGNEFGLGIPVDTGFARSSIRVGINAPVVGPSEPPSAVLQQSKTSKYLREQVKRVAGKGAAQITAIPDLSPILSAKLGDDVYITTVAEYPQYLELEPKKRRFGPNAGASTAFLEPVLAKFPAIVDDAAARVGYGEPR